MLTNNDLTGTQLKMGARYFLGSDMSVFANFGSINKVPILDQAIDDEGYAIMDNPVQENFTSIEVGTKASLMNNQMTVNAVYYNSTWKDRQARKYAQNAEGQSIVAQIQGLDQLHTGIEVEVAYQPMPLLRVDAALGLGNWTYTDDVKAKLETWSDDRAVRHHRHGVRHEPVEGVRHRRGPPAVVPPATLSHRPVGGDDTEHHPRRHSFLVDPAVAHRADAGPQHRDDRVDRCARHRRSQRERLAGTVARDVLHHHRLCHLRLVRDLHDKP